MSVRYVIYPKHGLIHVVYSGSIAHVEIVDLFTSCLKDPAFRPDLDVLLEMRGCTFNDGSFAEVSNLTRRMDAWYAARLPTARSALVAPGDLEFGMARMYQMTADRACQSPIDVFRTVPEGLAYLDKAHVDPAILTAAPVVPVIFAAETCKCKVA